jgi:hypothetical protein
MTRTLGIVTRGPAHVTLTSQEPGAALERWRRALITENALVASLRGMPLARTVVPLADDVPRSCIGMRWPGVVRRMAGNRGAHSLSEGAP